MDQKKRGILDMNETLTPLVELLNRQGLKERYEIRENEVDLLFY
jgi:protein CMS1